MQKSTPDPALSTDLLHILNSAGVTVFAQDRDLKYRWVRNCPASWSQADPSGLDDAGLLPPAAAAIASAIKRDVISSGRAQWGEIAVETNGSSNFFELFVEPQRDDAGTTTGLLGIAIDVTARRTQAETLEAVARDLSHRTKNLLAIIQSLAAQTARNAPSTDAFIDQFRGRIQSISRSQDISIGPKRHGAKLSELIETQVFPYVDERRRVRFEGDDFFLSPNAALHIGLALYELCIAASASGTFSGADGNVVVTAEATAGSDGAQQIGMTWHEGGRNGDASIEGFARVLLERIVPAAVGGKASLRESTAARDYSLMISEREIAEA